MALVFSDDRPPVPPADFVDRIARPFDPEESEKVRAEFDASGADELRQLEQALRGGGHEFTDFDRLLDFGCGCGRFVRHLGLLSEAVESHGVDIDADVISWLQENVPFGSFVAGPQEPPLRTGKVTSTSSSTTACSRTWTSACRISGWPNSSE